MGWLKAIAGAIGLADLWSKYFVKKDDQNTGRQLQNADNQAANLKADENAAIIQDANAALGHDALVAKLHGQTGAQP